MNTYTIYDYQGLANDVLSRGIDIAESFEDWTKLAMSLAELGDLGRSLFHQLASVNEKYNKRESERKFADALRSTKRIGISTFIWMCQQRGIDTKKYYNTTSSMPSPVVEQKRAYKPQRSTKVSVIPQEYIDRSRSNKNNLLAFLCKMLPTKNVCDVADAYRVGTTKDGGIIYWQIDTKNRCRTGKVMLYNADTGHRIKDKAQPNKVTWVHSLMIRNGWLPESWKDGMEQCLFGEHLLADEANRGKVVAVVEAEKTALIASAIIPNYVWVACGGEMMFSEARLQALVGRRVIAFPDAHPDGESFRKWSAVASKCTFCTIEVSGILEREASTSEKEQKIDIADWLLREAWDNRSEAKKNLDRMLEVHPSLQILIDKLQLELQEE